MRVIDGLRRERHGISLLKGEITKEAVGGVMDLLGAWGEESCRVGGSGVRVGGFPSSALR